MESIFTEMMRGDTKHDIEYAYKLAGWIDRLHNRLFPDHKAVIHISFDREDSVAASHTFDGSAGEDYCGYYSVPVFGLYEVCFKVWQAYVEMLWPIAQRSFSQDEILRAIAVHEVRHALQGCYDPNRLARFTPRTWKQSHSPLLREVAACVLKHLRTQRRKYVEEDGMSRAEAQYNTDSEEFDAHCIEFLVLCRLGKGASVDDVVELLLAEPHTVLPSK